MDHTDRIIAESIDYLVAHYNEQPALDFLAERAGYDSAHFQKLFREKAGISPKRLMQYMNMRQVQELLNRGRSTMDTALSAGLSGTGRLYDLCVSCAAVTPGDVQHGGRGLGVQYGWHPTQLGEILVAQTERGVCYLGFVVDGSHDAAETKMRGYLPHAVYSHNADATLNAAAQIMAIWRGADDGRKKLKLDLHGTNMQIQVWQALLKIPTGETATYKDIAGQIGKPKAARAVGNAVGANPVSLLIPCHRVIRATGIIDNYGWGSPRKKLILGLELASRTAR